MNEIFNNMEKTFKELGLTFDFTEGCVTCGEGSCHNVSTSLLDGEEYSVHIQTDGDMSVFIINATKTANTSHDNDIEEVFYSEEGAVDYLCNTFESFKCF